jgi:hypothetical protein
MAKSRPATTKNTSTTDTDLAFEKELFASADKLRSNMDAAENKHFDSGLRYMKYFSGAFWERWSDGRNATDNPIGESSFNISICSCYAQIE